MLRMNQDLKTETLALLKQFGQVILSGPPGTGKTRLALHVAASILGKTNVEALPIGEDSPFAFVQFHPSYNYEDFVRGIRVETDANNNVVYKTENRTFGEMAERAAKKPTEKHVLVIDEINRANVSAVLGELIYGLEYRGKEVQTPYKVNGKKKGNEGGKGEDKGEGNAGLVIPKNLQIIGTMNTADRTIGQIDYAVRRRFAFVHCPPDVSVVENIGGVCALDFFKLVDGVFAYLSADHDKEDVCIGHSYFLADGVELANKIIYQVVPILREYVKDGVLKKEAEENILTIERKAEQMEKNAGNKIKELLHNFWHIEVSSRTFWKKCREHGFLPVEKLSDEMLQKIDKSDIFLAYIHGCGYVGYGQLDDGVSSMDFKRHIRPNDGLNRSGEWLNMNKTVMSAVNFPCHDYRSESFPIYSLSRELEEGQKNLAVVAVNWIRKLKPKDAIGDMKPLAPDVFPMPENRMVAFLMPKHPRPMRWIHRLEDRFGIVQYELAGAEEITEETLADRIPNFNPAVGATSAEIHAFVVENMEDEANEKVRQRIWAESKKHGRIHATVASAMRRLGYEKRPTNITALPSPRITGKRDRWIKTSDLAASDD